jgi:UDP-glucuronate decarboxylase
MATDQSVTGPMNLGNPHEITIRELAERVIDMTGSKSKLIFKDLPADDPLQRKPDITFARNTLDGWEPKITLEEGLGQRLTISAI